MIRWSDNQHSFGPFAFSIDRHRQWGLSMQSRDDEDRDAYARVHLGRWTFIALLPSWLIRPYREKVKFTHISEAEKAQIGRDWYWRIDEREFGAFLSNGALHVRYGRQTNEWPGSKSRCFFLPWREWRQVRHSLYDMNGDLFAHVPDDWDDRRKLETACPVLRFDFLDFDGERITATTRIEERQWKAGAGKFKWLSWFKRDRVERFLDLQFSSEVGNRKGSWKGGTVGHSITMLPTELHEAAFRRYCQNEGLTFIAALKGASHE